MRVHLVYKRKEEDSSLGADVVSLLSSLLKCFQKHVRVLVRLNENLLVGEVDLKLDTTLRQQIRQKEKIKQFQRASQYDK